MGLGNVRAVMIGLPVFILLIVILFNYLNNLDNKKLEHLKKEGLFTIGITQREYKYRVETVVYKFYYQHKIYEDSNGSRKVDSMLIPDGRYYVVFSKYDPSISYVLYDYQVPESILESPAQGWTLEELKKIDQNIGFDFSNIEKEISIFSPLFSKSEE